MMISDPWGLLLNQSGGGSIDMSRGFSGFGNLPPLDWMPTPGSEHGVHVGGQFPWNDPDPYTYFRWYESVLFERAREEDRRLLLGGSAKFSRMLLADNSVEIQYDVVVAQGLPAGTRTVLNGVEYELVDENGFKVWRPRSQGWQPTAPPKSMPDWLEQFAAPFPLDPTASSPATSPTSSPFETPPARDARGQDLLGLLSWAPLSAPSASPISPTWVPPANRLGAATIPPASRPSLGDSRLAPAPPNVSAPPGPAVPGARSGAASSLSEWLYKDSLGILYNGDGGSGDAFKQSPLPVDTGSIPGNYAINTWLSLGNVVAGYLNAGVVITNKVDDFFNRHLGYGAIQTMLPMSKAMGIAVEAGPAIEYSAMRLSTWWSAFSTNPRVVSAALAPIFGTLAVDGGGTLAPESNTLSNLTAHTGPDSRVYQLVDVEGEAWRIGETVDVRSRLSSHANEFGRNFRGLQIISDPLPLPQVRALEGSLGETLGVETLSRESSSVYKLGGNWVPELEGISGAGAYNVPTYTILNPAFYPWARGLVW